jgi:hypothetical protein
MQAFFLPQYTTASLADVLISVSEFSADTRIVDRGPVNTELMALVPAPETNCRSLFWSFLNQSFKCDFADRARISRNVLLNG